jgi:hypothetical protein
MSNRFEIPSDLGLDEQAQELLHERGLAYHPAFLFYFGGEFVKFADTEVPSPSSRPRVVISSSQLDEHGLLRNQRWVTPTPHQVKTGLGWLPQQVEL